MAPLGRRECIRHGLPALRQIASCSAWISSWRMGEGPLESLISRLLEKIEGQTDD